MNRITLSIVLFLGLISYLFCCTNFLVTPGASVDGSAIISYAADSHTLYGDLYHYKPGTHPPGTMRDIIDWDTKIYLGKIEEAPVTYNVIGNMNEWGLAIGETTFGGLKELQKQKGAILDYGSLIYITLQRSRNAREAIGVMDKLVQKYGYYSEGESFSIADKNEIWILEMIGKGNYEKGAVWVAVKIPDGMISAHANQARIRSFPLNDPENCVYSHDVISFAKKHGFYQGSDYHFSFSDVYDKVTFGGARWCEVRVWNFFGRINQNATFQNKYLDYVQGRNLDNRMPLWIKPKSKIHVKDVMDAMRDHGEGTWFDMTKDLGAAPFGVPYRWRPLTWDVNGVKYCNERVVATQQTAWSFVAQLRQNLPREIAGLLWWGPDDTGSTVYAPMYCGMTDIPKTHKTGHIMKFSFDSCFWVFNMVANWAYSRYNLIYPEVRNKIDYKEMQYLAEVPSVDQKAAQLYQHDKDAAIDYITKYSVRTGEELTATWLEFWKHLFTKYMDGNVKTPRQLPTPKVEDPGYPQSWWKRVVKETGDHFRVYGEGQNTNKKFETVSKREILMR